MLIDAQTKWIKATCTSSMLNVVAEELLTVFAEFGLPETVVTDNGSAWVCKPRVETL